MTNLILWWENEFCDALCFESWFGRLEGKPIRKSELPAGECTFMVDFCYFQSNTCTQICCCVEGKQNCMSSDPMPPPLYLGLPTAQLPTDSHFPHFGLTIRVFEFTCVNTMLIPLYHVLYIYIHVFMVENLIFLTPSKGHSLSLYLKFSRQQ